MDRNTVIVFGRFPPPIDGQALATRRFVSLIENDFDVIEIDTNIPSGASAMAKFKHYLLAGLDLRSRVSRNPDATIVWQSISPQPSGHLRDFLTVLPHLGQNPRLAVVHWGKFDAVFRHPLTRWTSRTLGKTVELIVFTTESLSDACSEWLPGNMRAVIPNTVDDATLCTDDEVSAKRDGVSFDPFRVLYLSNMIREKGYFDVLEAATHLKNDGRNVHFDFVGSWTSQDDRIEFERFVTREDLGESVTHHGAVSDRAAIRQFHLLSHAFVLPSYHVAEAQPLSILEAMSSGTPVIATHQGGIPDMVRDRKEAFLVPIESPKAIQDAIVSLLDADTWTAMSLRARKRFLEKYHPDVIRKQWKRLLQSL